MTLNNVQENSPHACHNTCKPTFGHYTLNFFVSTIASKNFVTTIVSLSCSFMELYNTIKTIKTQEHMCFLYNIPTTIFATTRIITNTRASWKWEMKQHTIMTDNCQVCHNCCVTLLMCNVHVNNKIKKNVSDESKEN
jgi:hypothetical protein